MTRKFDRNYNAIIQVSESESDLIEITLPFTVEFDVTRNTLSSANVCQLRFKNLSKLVRDKIRKNAYDFDDFRAVAFQAGYGDDLAVVFTGNISQAWSEREGVDMVTYLECFDGGYAFVNGVSSRSFPSGTRQRDMIFQLFADLPRLKPGVVSPNETKSTRATVLSGNTKEILDELTGGGFFVDNGVAHSLRDDEYIDAPVVVISPQSGLLGTPKIENNIVHVELLFEPNLVIGQLVRVESFTEKSFNGLYKITAVKHRGTISGAVCGSAVTEAQFFFNKELTGI